MTLTGNISDYFIVFWGGVLVSFTPCIYPVIPITASFIGGINTKGSKLMGFVISLLYVFGIAVTYCSLGVFASLSGKIFGQMQNNPLVHLSVGCILLFFGLVMLDIVMIPSFGASLQTKIKPRNLWTVILFGMAAGLVVGPCTTPVLVVLLLYVASKQNIVHGISLLFVFSYGLGASLILIGTFSGVLSNLPKSGPWMLRIKQLCGIVLLLIAGFYFFKAGKIILL